MPIISPKPGSEYYGRRVPGRSWYDIAGVRVELGAFQDLRRKDSFLSLPSLGFRV